MRRLVGNNSGLVRRNSSSSAKTPDSSSGPSAGPSSQAKRQQSVTRRKSTKNEPEPEKVGFFKRLRMKTALKLKDKGATRDTYMVKDVDEDADPEDKKRCQSGVGKEGGSEQKFSDPRFQFVEAYVNRGVRQIVLDFGKVRHYAPKNNVTTFWEKNPARNRYADVTCRDSTRIVIKNRPPDDDYIHANRITPHSSTANQYICTQGPMPDTIEDFWQMVLQERSNVVVMLCDFVEQGTEKCSLYYPLQEGETKDFGAIKVRHDKSLSSNIDAVVSCSLGVDGVEDSLTVTHLRWSSWVDHYAPNDATAVLHLLKLAKSLATGPIVVHCSAGIGRTGTFVAVDYVNEKLNNCSNNFSMTDIRNQRLHSIQCAPQYVFLHLALLTWVVNDNPGMEKLPAFKQFSHDYEKYLRKLKAKLARAQLPQLP